MRSFFLLALAPFLFALPAPAQDCDPEPPLQHYSGGGMVVCPCFVGGEEAGSVFEIPPEHFPIEVMEVGVGWSSQYGGTGQTLEQSIHVYGAGLPDPGARVLSLGGPVLTDGAINVFDLHGQLLGTQVDTGPVTVTLEFLNDNAGQIFAPSVVHDGNGCQTGGRNVIRAIPGGWSDSCDEGLTGDWIFFLVYRRTDCGQVGVEGELVAMSAPVFLMAPRPNPLRGSAEIEFALREEGEVAVAVYDLSGRRVAELARGAYPAGRSAVRWDGRDARGARVPRGLYFVALDAGGTRSTRKVVVAD